MLGMLTPSWWGQGGYGFLALSHVKAGARLLQGSPLHHVQTLTCTRDCSPHFSLAFLVSHGLGLGCGAHLSWDYGQELLLLSSILLISKTK